MADQAMRMPARLAAPVHLLQQTGIHQPDGGDAPKANLDSLISDTISGGGRALDEPTRISMESRFGHDFSGVRVYTDSRAAQSARALNALAYTVSRDVVFAAGQYAPNTRVGQRLLAHELTHVVQQSGGNTASVQRDLIDDIAEKTAKDLNQQIAGNPSPYSHVISAFNDLSSDIEDNVASAFLALQPDSKLEQFAADPQGRVMLDVLYEAMITGHVSSFESLQSERILIAKAKWISTDEYVAQAERIQVFATRQRTLQRSLSWILGPSRLPTS